MIELEGWATRYNTVHSMGPVRTRASSDTDGELLTMLESIEAAPGMPLLWDHEPGHEVGVVTRVRQFDDGLWITARSADARVARWCANGAPGLSVGSLSRARQRWDGDVLVFTSAAIDEVSIVSYPAVRGARVRCWRPLVPSGEGLLLGRRIRW